MKLLAPIALIVAALALVVYWDDTPTDADIVFVNQNEVFTLDPQRMSYMQDLRLAHVLYEGLVRWDNHDFSILPAAAETLPTVSSDGRTYTFRIRPGAMWSNGDPVTAYDFMYSWQRAVLPDTAADYSNLFFAIDGALAFFDWRVAQTQAFTVTLAEDAPPDAQTITAVSTRLRGLIDARDLPPAIAGILTPAVRAGIDEALAAIATDPSPDAPRAFAAACRPVLDALKPTRRAEAEWMLARADAQFARTVGLRALDTHTLEVRLARPTAYFLDLLCFGVFFPVHRPTVEGWPAGFASAEGWHAHAPPPLDHRSGVSVSDRSGKLEQRHGWAHPGRHVGNGTHRLAQWRYKRDLRLERNERYHDQSRIRSDSILALTIEDTNTAVLAFESGGVDWLADVSAEYESDMIAQLATYKDHHRDRIEAGRVAGRSMDEILASLPPPGRGERRNIHVFPTFGTDFYSFNCRPRLGDGSVNVFADARVRRAFAKAIDKQTIVDRVTRLHEPVLETLIPPGSIPGYTSPEGLGYDADAARSLLAEAGWRDRDEDGLIENDDLEPFPIIDLLYTTNIPRYKWISLNLKAQWEEQLGVRVELRSEETKFYRDDLKQGKFMIARGRWYGDYGDPTTFLDLCRSTDGNNDRGYASEQIDALLDACAIERDPNRRMNMLSDCESLLFGPEGDTPMLVLCQLVQVYMYEPGRVTGLSDHPRLTQFLWQMKVDEP